MSGASFSLLPSHLSIVGIIANTLFIGYLVHVLHKLTKTVLISEFARWNELKRFHVIATALGIVALIANTLEKAGCTAINDRDGQYPLECNILVIALMIPFLTGNILIFFESVIFSYCRLYMILPGIFCVN
jgi:Na+/serine symporter